MNTMERRRRGSTEKKILSMVCLLCVMATVHARPPTAHDDVQPHYVPEAEDGAEDDPRWKMDWWDTEEKQQDKKDGWKVFKTDNKALKRRWWEQDWQEEEWWAPNDRRKGSSSSRTKYTNKKKKGEEDKADSLGGREKQPMKKEKQPMKKEKQHQKKEGVSTERVAQPHPPSLSSSGGKTLHVKKTSGVDQAKAKKETPEHRNPSMPPAESPWERVGPRWEGEVLISPFEDPKPAPYPGSRDEAPDRHHWEHHQLTGLGKYIDHNHSKESMQAAAGHQDSEDKKKKTVKDSSKTVEKHGKPSANVLHPEKPLDQFYGFGLESTLSAPASELKEVKNPQKAALSKPKKKPLSKDRHTDEATRKDAPGKASQSNYNQGVIYDMVPAHTEQTHPVKKNLILSVKKEPTNVEYAKEFVSTKASLQTSPNPPPPGLAHEGVDSKTTPVVPSRKAGKNRQNKHYVKSRPLTFCKLDEDCRKGRTCRRGLCTCMVEGECKGHKPVCGSDGVEYPSHCELHRTACVTRLRIRVDRLNSCFVTSTQEEVTTTTTPPEAPHAVTKTSPAPETTSLKPVNAAVSEDSEDGDDGDNDDNDDGDDDADDEQYYNEEYYDDDYEEEREEEAKEEEEEEEKQEEEEEEEERDTAEEEESEPSAAVHGQHSDAPKAPPSSENAQEATTQDDKSGREDKTITKGDNQAGKVSKGDDHRVAPAPQSVRGGLQGNSRGDYDYQSDGSLVECSREELRRFKLQLLAFYCRRFQEPDCKLEVKEERDYLSNLLFSYLDMDTNYYVSFHELRTRQNSPHLPQLSPVCDLTDLIWNDDVSDIDGRLSLQEFGQAFAHLFEEEEDYESSSYHPDPKQSSSSSFPVVNIIPTLATVGNGLELKCGLEASGAQVVWKRHGVSIRDLDLAELLVLEDGSLFFSKMGVHHMGNYSCQNVNDPSVLQVHSLKVQMPPTVTVSPHSQIQPSKANAKIRCHAEGVPRPALSWQMDDLPLYKQPRRYSLAGNNEQLTIYQADYQRDTGTYKCVAKNQAGTSQDLSSLFIIGDKDRSVGMGFTDNHSGKFAVFHNQGYTVYDPDDCLKHRTVHGDFGYFKFIPDSLDRPLRLCEEGGECSWGKVVNVRDSLLYVTQPTLNRVVVIETTKNWIPVQVIATDRQPMQVYYVSHLDQVWVLCWSGEEEESNKTMVVVRDASKYIQHRVVHTQPVGNRFDQIQALFIAPANDLRHTYDYGYVTHSGQQTLTKLDLDNMRYVNTIHLSPYDCVPRSLAFVPIGGHVVVECVSAMNHQTLQLVLDYLTDAVVSTGLVSGRPHVSPDSRHVVTVDDLTGKVSVAGVSNEGTLEAAYEVTVSASISDVAFFPALGHGYLLVLTSADDDDIITINLSTGKVEKMKGTNRRSTSSDWYPSPVKRGIISGDVFSDFLLAPSKSSLSIMDMRLQQVKCEYSATPRIHTAGFVRR
ncbi:uncharacterized protein LOC143293140 [Babylonia areolata]|uniref:uncharacterized protein LOC143293140 n=1 Tax=Babylonia areolata TaxID=304850 RepID=UPI003FD5F432